MYVTECSVDSHIWSPETARDEMTLRHNEGKGWNAIDQLRAVAGLCNAGEFDAATYNLPLHERKINGDATDQAILRLSESFGPINELRQFWTKNFELAFNSKNKFMIRTLSLVNKSGLGFALARSEVDSFTLDDMSVYLPFHKIFANT